MQPAAKTIVLTLALLLLDTAGCGTSAPSPSMSASPTSPLATSTAHDVTPSVAPTLTATPQASSSPVAPVDLALDIQEISQDYTSQLYSVRSLGSEIIWAAGNRFDSEAGDLYRYVPGAAQPEAIYLNPRRGSYLTYVAGSHAGYVFTEEQSVSGQPAGWRLWFLSAAGGEPIMLDRSDGDDSSAPTIAMDDNHIAWAPVHGTGEDQTSELRVLEIGDLEHPQTLLAYSATVTNIWYPALWGDELWYGIRDNDWDAGTERPRVEVIHLDRPTDPPAVVGVDQRAFMPAANDEVVAWKGGGEDWMSAMNSGELDLLWRASNEVEIVRMPSRSQGRSDEISYPSLGDRFVTWWDDGHDRLYVYDLELRILNRIAEYPPTGEEGVIWQTLSGSVLAFVYHSSEQPKTLKWARLPE